MSEGRAGTSNAARSHTPDKLPAYKALGFIHKICSLWRRRPEEGERRCEPFKIFKLYTRWIKWIRSLLPSLNEGNLPPPPVDLTSACDLHCAPQIGHELLAFSAFFPL